MTRNKKAGNIQLVKECNMNKRLIYFMILTVALTIGFAVTGVISFADEPAAANAAVKVEVTKGIVNASKLNLRSNPGTNYAIVGQLTLGTEVSVLEQSGDWYRIKGENVTGWVHGGYIKGLNQKTETMSAGQQVSRGAYSARTEIKEVSLNGSSKQGEAVVAEVKNHLGKPYRYGSMGPNSFDCSGLVSYCYKSIGISVPRSSKDYGSIGSAVSADKAAAGDIVCFNTSGRGISHVGIYIGNGDFIHAASGSSTHRVMVNNLSDNYFSKRLVTIRRIL